MIKPIDIVKITKQLFTGSYWTKVNTIEALSFTTKLVIIIPGLLFNTQWWWLYIFALASSGALVLTSTIKTLPTIIYFNVMWMLLAFCAILKHFIYG